jgi:hypothetical protein
MALQFAMSGQPWICCDMKSPDATVLVRQYQVSRLLLLDVNEQGEQTTTTRCK